MSGNLLQLNSAGLLVLAKTAEGTPGTAGSAVLQAAGQPCCCGSSSYTNPCVNAPGSLAILNYTDSYFTPCPDATAAVSGDCVWDGVFDYFDAQTCSYSNRYCFDGNSCFDCSFNGKRMWEFQPPGISSVWYNAGSKTFFMQITCQNGQNSGEIVWQGGKTTGPGFSGTYTRTGGCDTRATAEIG
jgi:hypothetical protein